jgi:hypothetical protein
MAGDTLSSASSSASSSSSEWRGSGSGSSDASEDDAKSHKSRRTPTRTTASGGREARGRGGGQGAGRAAARIEAEGEDEEEDEGDEPPSSPLWAATQGGGGAAFTFSSSGEEEGERGGAAAAAAADELEPGSEDDAGGLVADGCVRLRMRTVAWVRPWTGQELAAYERALAHHTRFDALEVARTLGTRSVLEVILLNEQMAHSTQSVIRKLRDGRDGLWCPFDTQVYSPAAFTASTGFASNVTKEEDLDAEVARSEQALAKEAARASAHNAAFIARNPRWWLNPRTLTSHQGLMSFAHAIHVREGAVPGPSETLAIHAAMRGELDSIVKAHITPILRDAAILCQNRAINHNMPFYLQAHSSIPLQHQDVVLAVALMRKPQDGVEHIGTRARGFCETLKQLISGAQEPASGAGEDLGEAAGEAASDACPESDNSIVFESDHVSGELHADDSASLSGPEAGQSEEEPVEAGEAPLQEQHKEEEEEEEEEQQDEADEVAATQESVILLPPQTPLRHRRGRHVAMPEGHSAEFLASPDSESHPSAEPFSQQAEPRRGRKWRARAAREQSPGGRSVLASPASSISSLGRFYPTPVPTQPDADEEGREDEEDGGGGSREWDPSGLLLGEPFTNQGSPPSPPSPEPSSVSEFAPYTPMKQEPGQGSQLDLFSPLPDSPVSGFSRMVFRKK